MEVLDRVILRDSSQDFGIAGPTYQTVAALDTAHFLLNHHRHPLPLAQRQSMVESIVCATRL